MLIESRRATRFWRVAAGTFAKNSRGLHIRFIIGRQIGEVKLLCSVMMSGLLVSVSAADRTGKEKQWDWKYTEPVHYAENHDPAMVWLKDGRKLQVLFGAITWQELDQWNAGRKLTIVYEPGTGACLRDDGTGKAISIMNGLTEHPIDVLRRQYGEKAVSTLDMIELCAAASQQWEGETKRVHEALLRRLPAQARASFAKAQEAWESFRKADTENIARLYDQEGTVHRVLAAERCMELRRQRALTLINYLNDAPGE